MSDRIYMEVRGSMSRFDPLTEAPAPITPAQRKEAGVDAKPKKRGEEVADEGKK